MKQNEENVGFSYKTLTASIIGIRNQNPIVKHDVKPEPWFMEGQKGGAIVANERLIIHQDDLSF